VQLQRGSGAGDYTRSHFRSPLAYLAPFHSTSAYFVPQPTQTNPWMVPKLLKLSSNVSEVFPKVLKLSSEVSECKPLVRG